jgi:hypothetical protein
MENQLTCNSRRKFLAVAVSTVLKETGFDTTEKDCLETLTEMLQSRKNFLIILFRLL